VCVCGLCVFTCAVEHAHMCVCVCVCVHVYVRAHTRGRLQAEHTSFRPAIASRRRRCRLQTTRCRLRRTRCASAIGPVASRESFDQEPGALEGTACTNDRHSSPSGRSGAGRRGDGRVGVHPVVPRFASFDEDDARTPSFAMCAWSQLRPLRTIPRAPSRSISFTKTVSGSGG
jgi:hypothetical protein